MNKIQNNYAITKTIRFKLSQNNNALQKDIEKLNTVFSQNDLINLGNFLKIYSDLIEQYLFKTEKDNATGDELKKINFDLKIKDKFLRTYTKADYIAESISKTNFHKISQVRYIIVILENTYKRFHQLAEKFISLLKRKDENQARKSEFSILLKELFNKNNYIFIKEFIRYSQNITSEQNQQQLLAIQEQLEPLLVRAMQYFLPAQTSGAVIAKASLNYYTINKKPIDYDKEILAEKKYLDVLYVNQASNLCTYTFGYNSGADIYRKFIEKLLPNEVTIADVYNTIKKFKAEAKSKFYEDVTKDILTYETIKNNHPLFACSIKDFEIFQARSKLIAQLNGEINALNKINDAKKIKNKKSEISKVKQLRGKELLMSPPKGYSGAKNYIQLANLYKAIASKYGKQKAKIKSLEHEKIQSQLLNYWLLINQREHNRHELILIPKENRQLAKQILENSTKLENNKGENSIIWFKSLTLRALRKLCFSGTENTFAPELKNELAKYSDIKASYSLEDFKTEKELIEFYQTVISSDYFNRVVDIQDFRGFDALAEKEFSTMQQFELALEKICYTKIKIKPEEAIRDLLEQCEAQILPIESYDINKDKKRTSKDKAHTTLWQNFWTELNQKNGYPIRLNPEIAITYRHAKETRLKKYGHDSKNYNARKFKQNRYCHPQLTLITTLTENANSNKLDFSYLDNDKLSQAIENYNTDFNKKLPENKSNIFYYGIDRGNDELATLATIAQFGENSVQFLDIDIYKLKDITHNKEIILKDKTKKLRYAIDNISYFLDEEDLFEKVKSATIDLTTAKLIKGKIVANGDVKTYLKLKQLSARRRLYEHYSQANIENIKDIESSLYFNTEKHAFCIKTNDNNPEEKIYYYRDELKDYLSKQDVEKELKSYLLDLKKYNQERDLLTAEKINNLRDAISANMVGILAHIYQQHSGVLVLEDLNQDNLKSRFMESNESIGRRLEWALYKKIQHFSVVPPNLKDTIILRKSNNIKQFGAIIFVPENYTSKTCPSCEKIATFTYDDKGNPIDENYKNKNFFKKRPKEEKDNIKQIEKRFKETYEINKFQHRKFVCPHCNFDTSNPPNKLKSIDNPDTLASYNIAKRGYDYLKNPPLRKDNKKHYNQNNKQSNKKYRKKIAPKNHNKPATHSPFANLAQQMQSKKKE